MGLVHLEPRIDTLQEKILIGKRLKMSFANNRTGELWRSFMPMRKKVSDTVGTELYSMQIYRPGFFEPFDPQAEFEKWAAIEVGNIDNIPEDLEVITLPQGIYAVFLYKGAASQGASAYQYIFSTWLPNSPYTLDSRPHFEILGEKYKNEDPDSEEEIWIPIKLK